MLFPIINFFNTCCERSRLDGAVYKISYTNCSIIRRPAMKRCFIFCYWKPKRLRKNYLQNTSQDCKKDFSSPEIALCKFVNFACNERVNSTYPPKKKNSSYFVVLCEREKINDHQQHTVEPFSPFHHLCILCTI